MIEIAYFDRRWRQHKRLDRQFAKFMRVARAHMSGIQLLAAATGVTVDALRRLAAIQHTQEPNR